MPSSALFIVLLGFWALLSGKLDPGHDAYLMGAGVVCSAMAVLVCRRLRLLDAELAPLGPMLRLPRYLPWLLREIAHANLDVFRRVMSAERPISPRVFRAPCSLRTAFGRAVYANSITLTPGTVVIDVKEDGMLIHALTAEAERGVLDGAMERQVARLEGGGRAAQ